MRRIDHRVGLYAGLVILALLAASGAPARAQQHLTADTAATTAAGASFTAPADWRAGSQWTVAIVEASQATFEKRNAQFGLAIGSLRPKGYTRETFAGKLAHKLDAARIGALQEFARTAMTELGIPGVGLALLDGG